MILEYYTCEHCNAVCSNFAYHDCAESKAFFAAHIRASERDMEALVDALRLDRAAARQDERAKWREAPKGTWR